MFPSAPATTSSRACCPFLQERIQAAAGLRQRQVWGFRREEKGRGPIEHHAPVNRLRPGTQAGAAGTVRSCPGLAPSAEPTEHGARGLPALLARQSAAAHLVTIRWAWYGAAPCGPGHVALRPSPVAAGWVGVPVGTTPQELSQPRAGMAGR